MVRRVTLSGDQQILADIALHHVDLENALRHYFSPVSPIAALRFVGYSATDLSEELQRRLVEIDFSSSFAILAAVEASFRIDYIQRCQQRKKDGVSRIFREIHAEKGYQASLDDDILSVWADTSNGSKIIVGELRDAFRFRHWLAHGRYWTPKLGRRYDFYSVFTIASAALNHFALLH
jgi:hypothetical protein